MPCYQPKPASVLLANVKWEIPEYMPDQISCGKCLGCRARKAQEWSLRLYHESQLDDRACFITLTYSPEHLPEGATLVRKHPTDFLKRLREQLKSDGYGDKHVFRYYLVGEYGDETKRPHYHAILFGFDFPDRKLWMHRRNDTNRPVFRSALLEQKWPYGNSDIEPVGPGAMRYVAGYVQKKLDDDPNDSRYARYDPDTGETWDVLKEYSVMSRRPGIGHNWIQRHWREVYPSDQIVMDGKHYVPPLYYDRWMQSEHKLKEGGTCWINGCEEHQEAFEETRRRRVQRREDRQVTHPFENGYARLQDRFKCHQARHNSQKRDIA